MSPAEVISKASAATKSNDAQGAGYGKDEQRCTSGIPCAKPVPSSWLEEPSSKLMGFRSTHDLPTHADIVIVGSGITGAFAAHFLKEGLARDLSVIMLEAREACWGATGQNIGVAEAMVFSNAWDVSAFTLENLSFVRDFVKENDIPCEWKDCLGVHLFRQPILGFAMASAIDIKNALPESLGQMVDTAGWGGPTAATAPAEGENVTIGDGWDVAKIKATLAGFAMREMDGVVLQANAATLNPYRLVAWILERLLEQHRATRFALHTHTPVMGLSWRSAAPAPAPAAAAAAAATTTTTTTNTTTTTPEGGGWMLATPRGNISAGRVLLATNGYTTALLPKLADLVVPVRCQGAAASSPLTDKVDLDNKVYTFLNENGKAEERVMQRAGAGGQLIVEGGRNFAADFGVGHWRDDMTEPDVEERLESLLEDFTCGKSGAGDRNGVGMPEVSHWTGIEGYSRDRYPWVGAVPESLGGGPGLFLCAGYTLNGMTMAPLCARHVAQEIMTAGNFGSPHGVNKEKQEEQKEERPPTPPSSPGKFQFPSRLGMTAPGRLEIAREEWPEVQTLDEEGIETLIEMCVGQMVKGRNLAPPDLSGHSSLRRFEGKNAIGRKW